MPYIKRASGLALSLTLGLPAHRISGPFAQESLGLARLVAPGISTCAYQNATQEKLQCSMVGDQLPAALLTKTARENIF